MSELVEPRATVRGRAWRLRVVLGVVLAAAGAAGAFAVCHSIDPGRGALDTAQRVVATILALAAGMIGMFELHRARIEDAARGRVAPGGSRGPAAWRLAVGISAALFATALVLATGAEVAVMTVRSGVDEGSIEGSSGVQALERARERAAALEEASPDAAGPDRLVSPDPTGRSRRGTVEDATGSSAELGNLLSDVPVLEVLDPGDTWPDPERPIHLRGFVIEAFDGEGVLRERAGRRTVERAGVDGWIDRAARGSTAEGGAAPIARRSVELEVTSRGPQLELVFGPHRIEGVELPTIARDEASEALYLDALGERRSVRVRSAVAHELTVDQARNLVARESLPADHVALSLPVDRSGRRAFRAASARLDALARDLVADADSDFERVLAVVEHLRSSFAYELYAVDFLGTEGCAALIQRGGGSCTHFASLAVLLLRRVGIPARIAAGYVARERIAAADGGARWLVRQRDGHAWIEVHFEGEGWLPFDPTPGDATVGGALRGWSPLADREAERRSRRGRTSPLAALAIDGSRALIGSGAAPILAGLAVLSVIAVMLRASHRRAGRNERLETEEAAPGAVAERPSPDEGVTAVLRALRGRGWHARAGEPPRRHAARVEAGHPEAAGLESFVIAALERACDPRGLPTPPEAVAQGLQLANRISQSGEEEPGADSGRPDRSPAPAPRR